MGTHTFTVNTFFKHTHTYVPSGSPPSLFLKKTHTSCSLTFTSFALFLWPPTSARLLAASFAPTLMSTTHAKGA